MEDSRIEMLRALVAQAIEMRDSAERLIANLNKQLHLTMAIADDRGIRTERRKKPRT